MRVGFVSRSAEIQLVSSDLCCQLSFSTSSLLHRSEPAGARYLRERLSRFELKLTKSAVQLEGFILYNP